MAFIKRIPPNIAVIHPINTKAVITIVLAVIVVLPSLVKEISLSPIRIVYKPLDHSTTSAGDVLRISFEFNCDSSRVLSCEYLVSNSILLMKWTMASGLLLNTVESKEPIMGFVGWGESHSLISRIDKRIAKQLIRAKEVCIVYYILVNGFHQLNKKILMSTRITTTVNKKKPAPMKTICNISESLPPGFQVMTSSPNSAVKEPSDHSTIWAGTVRVIFLGCRNAFLSLSPSSTMVILWGCYREDRVLGLRMTSLPIFL